MKHEYELRLMRNRCRHGRGGFYGYRLLNGKDEMTFLCYGELARFFALDGQQYLTAYLTTGKVPEGHHLTRKYSSVKVRGYGGPEVATHYLFDKALQEMGGKAWLSLQTRQGRIIRRLMP